MNKAVWLSATFGWGKTKLLEEILELGGKGGEQEGKDRANRRM